MAAKKSALKGKSAPTPQEIADSYPVPPTKDRRPPRPTTTGAGRGRTTALTPELIERICDLIRVGNYIEVACRACGVTHASYYEWKKRGQEDRKRMEEAELRGEDPADAVWDTVFADFAEAVEHASAEAEANAVRVLSRHALTDTKAVVELLQRRFRKRWSKEERIAGADGQALVVKLAGIEREREAEG